MSSTNSISEDDVSKQGHPDPKLATGYILTGGWVIALMSGILTGDYVALQYVTPGWLIYLGFLFGDKVVFNRGGSS